MRNINADYYYGVEAEQFSFYRMPKLLITDERFKYLSNDAKLLYGLMLDRMSLSMSNHWLDKENRVYIIYTAEQIMQDMNCSNNKCAKILAELDSKKGIGLIERHKRGLGKPDIIYVKNFITLEVEEVNNNQVNEKKEQNNNINIGFSEMQNLNVQTWEKHISGDENNTSQKMGKIHTNNTDINNTDINNNSIHLINQEKIQLKEETSVITSNVKKENQKKNSGSLSNVYTENNKNKEKIFKNNMLDNVFCQNNTDNEDEVERAAKYIQIIRENIEYDIYIQDPDGEYFKEIYNLICDVISADYKSIQIGGVYYSHELVVTRFLQLGPGHIQHVISTIKNAQEKIHNIRSYMITTLYNAPCTLHHCYANDVNTFRY